MTHLNYTLLFRQIHKDKPKHILANARKDVYETIELNKDKPMTDPYMIKLWAELDVIRELMDK